jgi:hypothetical protein
MNRTEVFNKAHQEALDDIQHLLSSTKEYDAEFVHLAKWLFETDLNPYSILPDHWANAMDTSVGFAGLLRHIHHAMVDDGDICFPQLYREPTIRFISKHELSEKSVVDFVSGTILNFHSANTIVSDLKFLNSAYEFTVAADQYHLKWLKKCFVGDAKRHGIEFAVKHYTTYPAFDPTWVNLVEAE